MSCSLGTPQILVFILTPNRWFTLKSTRHALIITSLTSRSALSSTIWSTFRKRPSRKPWLLSWRLWRPSRRLRNSRSVFDHRPGWPRLLFVVAMCPRRPRKSFLIPGPWYYLLRRHQMLVLKNVKIFGIILFPNRRRLLRLSHLSRLLAITKRTSPRLPNRCSHFRLHQQFHHTWTARLMFSKIVISVSLSCSTFSLQVCFCF